MSLIHCKICGEEHAGTICTKFAGSSPRAAVVAKVKEIASRPVVEGPKGKAKKEKLTKRAAKKQMARRLASKKASASNGA